MKTRRDKGSGPADSSAGVPGLAVGTRVRTRASTEGKKAAESPSIEAGVIVDDFGEVLTPHDHYGRDWALSKRWAIALDSGSLVFRDDKDLELES